MLEINDRQNTGFLWLNFKDNNRILEEVKEIGICSGPRKRMA